MISIRKIEFSPVSDEKLKAFATVELADGTRIRGIQVIDGCKGRFVAVPVRRADFEFRPGWMDKETIGLIKQSVAEAFERWSLPE